MTILQKLKAWWKRDRFLPPLPHGSTMVPMEAVSAMMDAILRTKLAQAQQEPQRGVKPPHDPEVDKSMSFAAWRSVMDEIALTDDWTPCRFGTLYGQDMARFVFGCTRGTFGIYRQPFEICEGDNSLGEEVLHALIWLPGGLGVGLFDDASAATLTTDLIGDRLRGIDHPASNEESLKRWAVIFDEVRGIMSFHGIIPHPSKHAHDGKSGPLTVYTKSAEAVLSGKPEKLA